MNLKICNSMESNDNTGFSFKSSVTSVVFNRFLIKITRKKLQEFKNSGVFKERGVISNISLKI